MRRGQPHGSSIAPSPHWHDSLLKDLAASGSVIADCKQYNYAHLCIESVASFIYITYSVAKKPSVSTTSSNLYQVIGGACIYARSVSQISVFTICCYRNSFGSETRHAGPVGTLCGNPPRTSGTSGFHENTHPAQKRPPFTRFTRVGH